LYLYGKRSAPYFASFSEPWPSKAAYLSCRRQKLHVDASGREFVWSDAGGGKRCQRFIDDALREGAAVDDVWHLDKLNHAAGEALGYPTQKPEALLHRLIQSSCPPGGLVADFTAGAGTTASVAERLGRRWIAVDIGKPACMLTARRLLRQQGAPFVRQRMDEAPRAVCARCDVGAADGCPQALRLLTQCAALTVTHPAQHSAAGYRRGAVLGQAGFDQRTLLWIEPPCVCTGVDTLERAAALRDEAPTRWHRVVVLAWQVGPTLAQAVVTRADPRLAVLMAPWPLPVSPLTRNGRQRGQAPLRFAALRHLSVQPIVRTRDGAHEHLLVRLERFSVLCSGDPDFDEAGPHALRSNDEAASLALLQYWAVDVDYDAGDDGGCFRPCWCALPSTPGRGGRGLTLSTQVELHVPALEGPRTVCVRALDCFGHECEAVLRLDGGVRP
jgi:adenine-specific DNA-methyltransferase